MPFVANYVLATIRLSGQIMYLPRYGVRGKLCTCYGVAIAWQVHYTQQNCNVAKLSYCYANNHCMYDLLLPWNPWQVLQLPRPWTLRQNPIAMLGNEIVTLQNYHIDMLMIVACTTCCYYETHGKCSNCHARERCVKILLPCLATDCNGCNNPKHLQRQTRYCGNTLLPRDILQPLATNEISWPKLLLATKLGISQRFLVVA
jgi:hypothetical protein